MPPFDPTFLILIALMFGAMYFLMIRPQKKQQQETAAMQSSIAEGDRIMLTSGIFATVRHVGDKQMIVELAPATEITILRQAVLRKVAAEEEEFEFDDVEASQEAEVLQDADSVDDSGEEPGVEKNADAPNLDEQDSTKI